MKIEVFLDAETFCRFTIFDVMKLRKNWRSPVIFASILSVCATVCFIMRHVEGAVLLGSVLLIVGLGMPLYHFGSFFFSIHRQIRQRKLKLPQLVYTIELTSGAEGIVVDNGSEHAAYRWKQVFHVYRDKFATYLYLTPTRAFLLPHFCVEEGADALWELIGKKVPKDKCTDLRK